MEYSISVDEGSRITGICPDDLSGGGWIRAAEDRLTAHTGVTVGQMFSGLEDAHGVALYKWANGYAELRTAEEMAADAPESEPTEISEAERLDQIEAGLIELAALFMGGM